MTRQGRPLIVGVGTAGSSMANYIKGLGFDADYLYASFNARDVPDGNRFLDWRSAEYNGTAEYLKNLASDAEFVIVLGGLGGHSGSQLVPKVCELSSSIGAPTVAVVLLPFRNQNWMEFAAATALSRIRMTSAGVVVIDRQQFIDEEMKELPLEQVYGKIDEKVAFAVVNLLTESEKVVSVLCRGQSMMQLGDPTSGFANSLASVLKRTVAGGVKDVSDVFFVTGGSRPVTFDDSFTGSSGIRNILAPDSKLHFINGNVRAKDNNVVAMVSHVEGSLELRISDPLEKLNSSWIDPEPETGLKFPIDLERLD